MTTSVIVPVRNEWPLTRRMLASLDADQVDHVLVLDNGSEDQTASEIRSWQRTRKYAEWYPLGSKIHRADQAGRTIYEMWNHGFDWAMRQRGGETDGHSYVLVTNNDLILPHGAVGALRRALALDPSLWVVYPDYHAPWRAEFTMDERWPPIAITSGVLSDGGMFGACFMLAGHRLPWRPLISDLAYEWWYGDNHLAECIREAGGEQARIVGLPVEHVNEGTASKLEPGVLYAMKHRDRDRWLRRYDRRVHAG